ncbi:MAG: ferrochelatase [Rhodospirillales bacterium]|nr:ferrochelatase [Rhodospirillales bacterium]
MKTAVVLFNLGGPDSPDAVEPFLFNLFSDPAIIQVPQPFRWLLAKLISRRRAPIAREIYDNLGGKSPLLELTVEQAQALEKQCPDLGTVKTFICMRYWHPMSDATAKDVKKFDPDKIILLPLYPQYSTTTSGSSIKDWHRAATAAGISAPTVEICCYPQTDGWIDAQVSLIRNAYAEASTGRKPRVLFSAHGLPKKVVAAGDPYQWQVERTADAVVERLAIDGLDWVVCYQSQVGPLEWIGPSTDDEIKRAGADGVPVIVVPIAFVSEHSETLVELDIEYRELAEEHGVPGYTRIASVGTHPSFVAAMAGLVRKAVHADGPRISGDGGRICPEHCGKCAWA